MAKSVATIVLDQALNYVKNNGTRLCVCNAQPTDYTTATSTYKLAIKTISSSDYTGPADDSGGRKVTVNAQSGITVDASGTALYIAIADSSNSALTYVTTCTSQVLTAGNTVTVPAWKISFSQPT
jgi:hypothetical protein